jgi:hypothetical protein
MRSIYQEIIDEGNEILESGISHLRRRTREYSPIIPIKKVYSTRNQSIKKRLSVYSIILW